MELINLGIHITKSLKRLNMSGFDFFMIMSNKINEIGVIDDVLCYPNYKYYTSLFEAIEEWS